MLVFKPAIHHLYIHSSIQFTGIHAYGVKHHRAVEEDTSKVGLAMFDTTLAHDEEQLLPLIWAAQYMVRSGLPGYRLPEWSTSTTSATTTTTTTTTTRTATTKTTPTATTTTTATTSLSLLHLKSWYSSWYFRVQWRGSWIENVGFTMESTGMDERSIMELWKTSSLAVTSSMIPGSPVWWMLGP